MNNQYNCPPKMPSYDMAMNHNIPNQYMNSPNQYPQNSPVYSKSMHKPINQGSIYNNQPQNNYYQSMNRQNPNYQHRISQQRLTGDNGDLSMQPVNSHNINIMNPNSQYSDFNTNFYKKNNDNSKYGFFDVIPNLKFIFKQSKLSKWALIFIIFQVIVISTLETLLLFNYYKKYYTDFKNKREIMSEKEQDNFQPLFNQSFCLIIYQCIFIAAQIFVLLIYYDSFRISSSVQLITTSIFNFIIAGYSIYQIFQTNKLYDQIEKEFPKYYPEITKESQYNKIRSYLIAIACVLLFSAIVLFIMSLLLFKKFGWNIYRNVGADIKKTVVLKRRYTFGIVLKFKIFFVLGIIVQCLLFRTKDTDEFTFNLNNITESINKIVTSYAAFALTGILIINIISGYFSVKKENSFLMLIHILTDIIFIVFSIYMIWFILYYSVYQAVKNSLTGFASIELIIVFVSIYYSLVVLCDFNTVNMKDNSKNEIERRLSL